jgi:N-glycosylase/DNA lyase
MESANWHHNRAVWEDLGVELHASARRHAPKVMVRPASVAMPSLIQDPSLPCVASELIATQSSYERCTAHEPLGSVVDLDVAGDAISFYWGLPHELGTVAYWMQQTRLMDTPECYALGETLAEEIAACLLGGHGVPADIGLAAYQALRGAGVLAPPARPAEVYEALLMTPIEVVGRPRRVRYRFARQRAERLAGALSVLEASTPPEEPLALRSWLTELPGIGPKTASWIVRNYCDSNDVAIIDIHIQRAGLAAGFFSPAWRLPRDYGLFEHAFRRVAALAGVPAAALDACIWDQMRRIGSARSILLGQR